MEEEVSERPVTRWRVLRQTGRGDAAGGLERGWAARQSRCEWHPGSDTQYLPDELCPSPRHTQRAGSPEKQNKGVRGHKGLSRTGSHDYGGWEAPQPPSVPGGRGVGGRAQPESQGLRTGRAEVESKSKGGRRSLRSLSSSSEVERKDRLIPPSSAVCSSHAPSGLDEDHPARGPGIFFTEPLIQTPCPPQNTLTDTPRNNIYSGHRGPLK